MQMGVQNLLSEMETREEMAAIFKRFGDEQSALFDQYERLSFEVQLNKAMLDRSLSEKAAPSRCSRRRSGFQKVMKRLFSPILGNKAGKDGGQNVPKDPIMFLNGFSRSVRV